MFGSSCKVLLCLMVLSLKQRAEQVFMQGGRGVGKAHPPVASLFTGHSLPKHHLPLLLWRVAGAVHGRHIPPRAKEVHRLGETVVVDEAGIHREQPHQQQDIPAIKEHPKNLREDSVRADSLTGQWVRKGKLIMAHSSLSSRASKKTTYQWESYTQGDHKFKVSLWYVTSLSLVDYLKPCQSLPTKSTINTTKLSSSQTMQALSGLPPSTVYRLVGEHYLL